MIKKKPNTHPKQVVTRRCKSSVNGWVLPATAACFALTFSLQPTQLVGQQQPPILQSPQRIQLSPPAGQVTNQPNQPAEMPEDPYWQETVARAVEEFESDQPEVRRSAVMLLGKYPVAPAREVVGKALEDPAASVRQAALVALLEEQGQVNPAFADRMLRLLADPSVAIRRIASNSVRNVIFSFPFTLRSGTQGMQRQIPPEAERILKEAFRDADVSVRRSMVANYPFLQISLPEETVVALLHDPDQEVAVNTIRWGLNLLSPATLSREVEEFARHESEIFRLELARALQSHRSPEVLKTLAALQEDPDPQVALQAMLAMFNHQPSVDRYERMMDLYRESGQRSDAGQRIVFAAQMLGEAGQPFLREWMDASDPSLRQQAVSVYLNRFGSEADHDLLFSLLNDSVQGIRAQAMRVLTQLTEPLSDDKIRQTTSSRYADVRQAATGFAARLPADRAEDLLLDLLLDEVREVRLAALREIGIRQISGWQEIMSISLQVDDPLTQRTALEWLIRNPTPETLELLRAYRDENPQSPLRPTIDAHLRRHPTPD